jgi:hypothetical protein
MDGLLWRSLKVVIREAASKMGQPVRTAASDVEGLVASPAAILMEAPKLPSRSYVLLYRSEVEQNAASTGASRPQGA